MIQSTDAFFFLSSGLHVDLAISQLTAIVAQSACGIEMRTESNPRERTHPVRLVFPLPMAKPALLCVAALVTCRHNSSGSP